ncbi:MAG: hypothetical protein C0392_05755 [Syntrophus sp. (in: bacteria)]|nr:hypothetical protein [Syntrophus sp. (in: bacteria)]
MQSKRIFLHICMFLLASGLLGGYGVKIMSDYKYFSFVSNYSHLKPSPDKSGAEFHRKDDFNLKNYDKVLLDRIAIWYSDDAEFKGIDPTQLKALSDYFHETIVKTPGDTYPIVTEPGSGVLHIRTAITEIVATKPLAGVVVLVTPYATFADLASSTVTKGG